MKNSVQAYDIQLFAAPEGAENISGVQAPDAGGQTTGVNTASDAGEQDRSARFKALIEGEFKDEYNASVQSIVTKRLRGSEEAAKKYKLLAPAIAALEQRYGTQPGDAAALARALEDDGTGARQGAGEDERREKTSRLYGRWLRQAADLRGACPGFDLSKELKNPQFCELLRSGASVRAAYELANRERIMRAAARDMEEKLTRRILAGDSRPREGGLSGQSAAAVHSDVAGMSKAARQEIIRRVQRGEKIAF